MNHGPRAWGSDSISFIALVYWRFTGNCLEWMSLMLLKVLGTAG